MAEYNLYSGDQNCGPFWDTWPKLEFLAGRGHSVFQLIHDTDIIYRGQESTEREGIAAKWLYEKCDGSHFYSANFFYYRYLGMHNPFPVHEFEDYTGLKLSKIYSLLSITPELFFKKFGAYDKLALVGNEKCEDGFRIAAGLKISECYQQIKDFFKYVETDMLEFVVTDEQKMNLTSVLSKWQSEIWEIALANPGITLSSLFLELMKQKFGSKFSASGCSDYFRVISENKDRFKFFLSFIKNYEIYATQYNLALSLNDSPITRLDLSKRDFPFYGTVKVGGQLLRFPLSIDEDNLMFRGHKLQITQDIWPDILNWSQKIGLESIVGKAIPLMMQLRHKDCGGAISMPKLGSPYVSIVDSYARLLKSEIGDSDLGEVYLVDFRIFTALDKADFSFRLPKYLQKVFGQEIIDAKSFVEKLPALIKEAQRIMFLCRQGAEGRDEVMRKYYPCLVSSLTEMAKERGVQGQVLANLSKGTAEYNRESQIYFDIKNKHNAAYANYIGALCELLFNHWHASQIEYFNNRGSFELWTKSIGGGSFYQSLIDGAVLERRSLES